MFHLELRQFPHSTRAFNLTAEELSARFLDGWSAGRAVECDERQWAPDKARLTIYEGPRLRPDQIGMGRGWGNVTRSGREVTTELLSRARQSADAAPLAQLKRILLERCAAQPCEVRDAAALAQELWPGRRAGERLGLAEQAVWELLHEGRVSLTRGDARQQAPLERAQWQPSLLAWETWTGETRLPLCLIACAPP